MIVSRVVLTRDCRVKLSERGIQNGGVILEIPGNTAAHEIHQPLK